MVDADDASNYLDVGDSDGRTSGQVDSSMASTLGGHVDLEVCQVASLGGRPVKSSKFSRAVNGCGIDYNVLNGNEEDRGGVPGFGIPSIDNGSAAEVSASLDHRRILRVADKNSPNAKI